MRLEVAVVGVVIVALVAMAIIAVAVARAVDRRPSPVPVVSRYLNAIRDGNASAANDLFNPEGIGREHLPDDATGMQFMSDDALNRAKEGISDITIGLVISSPGTDASAVAVTYGIDGQRYERWVNLEWQRDGWRITTGVFQVLKVHAAFDGDAGPADKSLRVTLGGATAEAPLIGTQDAYFIAYPGIYPIALTAPGWKVADAGPSEVRLVSPNHIELVTSRYTKSP